jgi:hypothetical protein
MNTNVDMHTVAQNRKQISTLGGILGGKYFMLSAQETYPKFDEKKLENERNASLDFIPNRSPRRFIVRDHDVIAQTIVTDASGTTKVVFNPGTDDEATASIIAGNGQFGAATEDAIKDALTGQKVIFANGVSLADKANEYNQAEVDRLTVFIKQLQSQRDAIISTMKANSDKTKSYEQEIIASTPKAPIGGGINSPAIVIQPASTD